jgi:branched-chain amino acid transport system substrate-binding protein
MNRVVHRLWAAASVGLVVLGAVACLGWDSTALAADTVKIGAVVPLTGRYGAPGAQNKAGYEIAVETINRAGGVTVGRQKLPLQLVMLDQCCPN